MLPLRVLGDRVLVKPDVISHAPETRESGVVVAVSLAAAVTGEDPTRSVHRGTVVALGNPKHPHADEAHSHAVRLMKIADRGETHGRATTIRRSAQLLTQCTQRTPCCAVEDDVLFSHDAGQEITLAGETYILLTEAELLAIVEPEKEEAHG